MAESTEELGRKNQEIEKLKGIIDQQKAYISHTESTIVEQTDEETQKEDQTLQTAITNLESLAHQIASRITDQDSRIEENMNITSKLQQIIEGQIHQQLQQLYEGVSVKDGVHDSVEKLEEWKDQVDDSLSKLTTQVNTLVKEQLELNVNVGSLAEKQSSHSDNIRNIRNIQHNFLKIWLS
ncbi:unnamed protein product [Allacma fusca]|uniref:Uncharacterized protein n=1 Tax=Allacma fusca TaxID=39272 RepID=A0A8J2Q2J8_9HEXA|nr:unnamed protein product [Allacma fusca]